MESHIFNTVGSGVSRELAVGGEPVSKVSVGLGLGSQLA